MEPKVRCEQDRDCAEPVAMIDVKGFVYCAGHGKDIRRYVCRCRKLRPHELNRLKRGEPINRY